jgi:K+-sensing histidine kinase KdpD
VHDLRSPFLGLLDLSKPIDETSENLTEGDKKSIIKKVRNTIECLYNFLEELLLWGRIQQKSIMVTKEEVILNREIESILAVFEENLRNKKITVEFIPNDTEIVN